MAALTRSRFPLGHFDLRHASSITPSNRQRLSNIERPGTPSFWCDKSALERDFLKRLPKPMLVMQACNNIVGSRASIWHSRPH